MAEETAEEGLLSPIVVKTTAEVEETSVPKTSLWAGVATTAGTVDEAALLVSATLACVCGKVVTAGDETASGEEALMENWAMDADDVVTTGGGLVAAAAVASTCGGADTDTAVDFEEEDGGNDGKGSNDDDDDKIAGKGDKVEVLAVLVLACVLTSVLGKAVHLLPPSEVMKAPGGKFGLVDMTRTRVAMGTTGSWAIPVANFQSKNNDDDSAHCATGASNSIKIYTEPPFKGATEKKKREGKKREKFRGLTGRHTLSQFIQSGIAEGNRRGWVEGGDMAEEDLFVVVVVCC